jgi:MFS family permease
VAYIACVAVLLAFTVGAAVALTVEVFVAMRVLSGFQGCFLHVAGQTIIAEYFPPTQRGRANGFFLAGTVAGPPLGLFVFLSSLMLHIPLTSRQGRWLRASWSTIQAGVTCSGCRSR